MQNEPMDIEILGDEGTHHRCRKQDRACGICGHPEYCHNPEVPPTFPYDPTDICIGYMNNWQASGQARHGTRFMLPDPVRFEAFLDARAKLQKLHRFDPDELATSRRQWGQFGKTHGAFVCSCRAFVPKEEVKDAVAPLQDVQSP